MFEEYVKGAPLVQIVNHLNTYGARRLQSKAPFAADSILRILDNEIYVGDRLIQKQAPINYLTKCPDPTESFKQYYITNDHTAIINRAIWELVRQRREVKKENRAMGG